MFDLKEWTKIIELYQSGFTIVKIAYKYNCSRETIRKILIKCGVSIREKGSRNYNINKDFFVNIDTSQKAYILGFIFADGSIHKSRYSLSIELSGEDGYILEQMRTLFYNGNNFPTIHIRKIGNFEYKKLHISSKEFVKNLINLNVMPNKTHKMDFPMSIKKDLLPHFIRGFFDGDGTVGLYNYNGKNKISVGFCGLENFLLHIKSILSDANINTGKLISIQKSSPQIKRLSVYAIASLIKFYNFIYKDSDMFLKRKREKFEEIIKLVSKSRFINKQKGDGNKYKGVSFDTDRQKWIAYSNRKFVGRFDKEEEAAAAVAEHAKKTSINTDNK